ncbi:ABC transporter permease subunit [Phaeovulum vinaykumarii]|uniref:Thiamine transport system permease protein n=1 Tax=Phaeovulum vinaykumarii TaxID=407234 RepID=A0A1N7KRF6_9RHOB|nr:ABC transporter permease subunit [Phaeovulum vinaykumarii]SIS64193.1 thiamine transport system permease protein [Phaeovulum vinaykumarii]SOC01650.1 thiamine transport system permease protein [Phaeovulum vinaykumarii]
MAGGLRRLSAGLPAGLAAGALALLVLGTLGAVARQAGGFGGLRGSDLGALRFTLMQAGASALISVALAVPLARAIARRRWPGRQAFVTALGAPFLMPVIVAVMALIAVFGRSGALNRGLDALGLPTLSIYGPQGVVLAHVFLNLPFAARMILQGWATIPAERIRLARSLGFGPAEIARHLERPMLRAVLPGAVLAVFLVCLTSFAVAMTLGGGPRATTLELAIYQAFRFDFDPGRAASLGLLQVALCLAALAAAARVARPEPLGAGLEQGRALPAPGGWRRLGDGLAIALATLFLLAPLAAVTARGLAGLADLPPGIWPAAARSLWVAVGSGVLTLVLALPLALGVARGGRGLELAGMLPLVASPLVLGTGLFLLLRPLAAPADLALPVTLAVNAALSVPFALRILIPPARQLRDDYGRLAAALDLRGLARLRLLVLPRLARPLGFAGGVAAAFSMGDLGVIALFAAPDRATLPFYLYGLMGSYRLDAAAAAATLLVALTFALFWAFDQGGRRASA